MTRVCEVDHELPRGMEVIEDPEFVTLLCHWCGYEQRYPSAQLAAEVLVNAAHVHYAMSCRRRVNERRTPTGKGRNPHAA